LGGGLRYVQTGRLQNYALVIFLAIVIIAIYLAMGSPAKEMLAMIGGGN